MAKKKPEIKMQTYGIHSKWEAKSKALPKVLEFTTDIPAEIDIEFGFIINVKNARGKKAFYCIDHPGIYDVKGNVRPAFTGEVHITNNDWDFYLGDTIWAPIEDKCGPWRMTITLNDQTIADKTFNVSSNKLDSPIKQRFSYL
ncbi:DUF3859 domain-containing protein [Psychromonas sp. SR45-3]|uniref:DUF3859 domain-containing protein n=1 Tax=Psychromonas sp. SR45-3 TaxID=2760930 RepID=UPI0015FB0CEC|nr:DUF3859 domain-containing protein [Psychromonas sp. SR45-3]MBB1272568.1 DUF3859 domain-containing protein [Psychromonas sp. SR45-3]